MFKEKRFIFRLDISDPQFLGPERASSKARGGKEKKDEAKDQGSSLIEGALGNLGLHQERMAKDLTLRGLADSLEGVSFGEHMEYMAKSLRDNINAFLAVAENDQSKLDVVDPALLAKLREELGDRVITKEETETVNKLLKTMKPGGLLTMERLDVTRDSHETDHEKQWAPSSHEVASIVRSLNKAEVFFTNTLEFEYAGELFKRIKEIVKKGSGEDGSLLTDNFGMSVNAFVKWGKLAQGTYESAKRGDLIDAGILGSGVLIRTTGLSLHTLNIVRHIGPSAFNLVTRLVDDVAAIFVAEKGIGGRKDSGILNAGLDYARDELNTSFDFINLGKNAFIQNRRMDLILTQGIMNGATEFSRGAVDMVFLPEKVINEVISSVSGLISHLDEFSGVLEGIDPKKIVYAIGYIVTIIALSVLGGGPMLAKTPGMIGKLAKLLAFPDVVISKIASTATKVGTKMHLITEKGARSLAKAVDVGSSTGGVTSSAPGSA
jgi:hypothetical protein